MASTSASSIQKRFKYDVFLSFRGEDTRKNFVDHLYHALKRKGINSYKDDKEIKKGRRISDELLRSIEDSKFYIIVFSKNYASSSWCLDELVKIMECHRTNGHTAYPLFYDVEPTEVRNQSGAVEEAFMKHKEEEGAAKWRDALTQAANLAGWELKTTLDGHEAKFIEKIVEEISLELRFIDLSVDGKLVGMETRVEDVVKSLETDIDDFRIIGIKGMGGGGKTTLARVVFDQISVRFEGSSFVENVREASKNPLCGMKSLQKQVLSDVLNKKDINVTGVYEGKKMMKKMMRDIKVLVVLDDVDHIDQLEALAGESNWFKPGSRIIITTRDEQVLVAHEVPRNLILDVNLLSLKEAACLFNKYAFGRVIPNQGYDMLSNRVVRYASGLPLTIKVLGSFLRGKDELEWKDALERLKSIPLKETLEILELSYESLEEEYKEIFLDVACILKGWDKEEAIRALECCGFHARIGLKVLELKSLITVSQSGRLGMHDHIEEMGKNIVRRSHPTEPCRHSRVWIEEEIKDIFVVDKGTQEISCIKVQNVNPLVVMKGLRKLKELRFLDVICEMSVGYTYNDIDEDNLYLPNSLQYLRYDGYPFRCLPKKFQASNLVGLIMSFSDIGQLWEEKETKVLKKLRFLDLYYCKTLRSLNVGLIPNLERLSIVACHTLKELHIPVTNSKLTYLNLSKTELRTLDLELAQNLHTLKVKDNSCLEELCMPVESLNLKNLTLYCIKLRTLNLIETRILERVYLEKCEDLVELHMPIEYPSLKAISIRCSKLRTLTLTRIRNLEWLDLKKCEELVELQMPTESPKLKTISIIRCSKLRTLNLNGTRNLKMLELEKCEDLVELHMPTESHKLKTISIRCSKLRILNLNGTRNLEMLDLEKCEDFVELHMPTESPKLKTINIRCSKLRILHLGLSPCLERLYLDDCFNLVEIQVLLGWLSGSVRFKPFVVNQGFPIVGSIAELHLIAGSLGTCPLHPKYVLPKFHFDCIYKHLLLPSLTSNIKKLITNLAMCACKNLANISGSICDLQSLRKLTLEGGIPEVPKEIEHLECLEELTLLSTNIGHLPDSICMLKHLKLLQLKSCWLLTHLPEDLGSLEFLEEMRLTDCISLLDIPNSICEMKFLKCLYLTNCILVERLPKEIGRLKCLKELNIQGTGISDIPESIFQMEDLNFFI